MLEVVTASAQGLVSLERVKQVLGIEGTSQDYELQEQILTYSEKIEAYLRRRVVGERVRETFPLARGATSIQLSRYPIQAVYSVSSQGMEMGLSGISFDPALGSVYAEGGFYGRTTVEYQGGYLVVPRPLQNAVIEAMRVYQANGGQPAKPTFGVKSERLEGVSSTTYFSPSELEGVTVTEDVLAGLEPYRAYFVG